MQLFPNEIKPYGPPVVVALVCSTLAFIHFGIKIHIFMHLRSLPDLHA